MYTCKYSVKLFSAVEVNMQSSIKEILQQQFTPVYLEVINESSGHNVAPGAETHFKVVVASELFIGLSAVKRHQAIYSSLEKPLKQGVHALAIHAYTPQEWVDKGVAPKSPACLGGSKS